MASILVQYLFLSLQNSTLTEEGSACCCRWKMHVLYQQHKTRWMGEGKKKSILYPRHSVLCKLKIAHPKRVKDCKCLNLDWSPPNNSDICTLSVNQDKIQGLSLNHCSSLGGRDELILAILKQTRRWASVSQSNKASEDHILTKGGPAGVAIDSEKDDIGRTKAMTCPHSQTEG